MQLQQKLQLKIKEAEKAEVKILVSNENMDTAVEPVTTHVDCDDQAKEAEVKAVISNENLKTAIKPVTTFVDCADQLVTTNGNLNVRIFTQFLFLIQLKIFKLTF